MKYLLSFFLFFFSSITFYTRAYDLFALYADDIQTPEHGLMKRNTLPDSTINNSPKISSGTIKRIHFTSQFVDSRNIDIWLPDGYNTKKRYAVIYMHDGQMLFDSLSNWNRQEWMADETSSRLLKQKTIKKCIIVGISNNGKKRHAEFFPQKVLDHIPEPEKSNLLNLFEGPAKADDYLKFIVTELKPFIDSSFSTYPNQRNTFIAGSSMGGLISLYAMCEYPGIFSGAACLSTHWTGVFYSNNSIPVAIDNYLKNTLPKPANHKLYLDCGDASLDSLYPVFQAMMVNTCRLKGYGNGNFKNGFFPGEDHSERAWSKRLDIPLTFLLKNNGQ